MHEGVLNVCLDPRQIESGKLDIRIALSERGAWRSNKRREVSEVRLYGRIIILKFFHVGGDRHGKASHTASLRS